MTQPRNTRLKQQRARRERDFGCAKAMPSLHHKTCDPFDIKESEVVKWLCNQPTILQRIYDQAIQTGVIVFDKETGTWKGVDHE